MNQLNTIKPTDNMLVESTEQKLFYLVAGEASGDILGSRLMKALKCFYPNAMFKGIGGSLMIEQGLQSYYPMERLSVMGIVPILTRLSELLSMRKRLVKRVVEEKADCFIGIDAPVFNTDCELMLKNKGITTVHYVSPSVWAWRENRIFKIVKSVSLMICLFPFELEIYKKHKLPVVCIGHPLAEEIPLKLGQVEARNDLDLPLDKKILAILPGSRGSEMKFLLEPFINAAVSLKKQHPNMSFVIPCASDKRRKQVEKFLTENNITIEIKLFDGESRKIMQAADFILLASGTATLEAMLLKRPMVVAYKLSKFSFWVYSKLLKIKNFSLPNLLANKPLVSELIQGDCTVKNITNELNKLIHNNEHENLISEYDLLHKNLQLGGSHKAAAAIADLLEGRLI